MGPWNCFFVFSPPDEDTIPIQFYAVLRRGVRFEKGYEKLVIINEKYESAEMDWYDLNIIYATAH